MENKKVGYLIEGIALAILVIIFAFNQGLRKIVDATCSHGPSCTMYDTINLQTWISLAVVLVLIAIGLFLIFSKQEIKIVNKKVKDEKKKINLDGLDAKEKEVVKLIQESNGAIFQAELMEKLGVGKVGITRMLDKLEAKQIIERKRRGMNNIVVLKS